MSSWIDKIFINQISSRLQGFKWKSSNLASCRCMICGDSKRNKSKTRFYFYEKKGGFFVKCHNCDFGTTLSKFLEQFDRGIHEQYTLEKYRSGTTGRNESEPEYKFSEPKFGKCRTSTEDVEREPLCVGLSSLSELQEDHPAVVFLLGRQIPRDKHHLLYFAPNFRVWAKTIDPDMQLGNEPRLIIPIIHEGKLIGANCRSFDPKSTSRYITLRKEKSEDRMWFGLDRVDSTRPVVVVEGPLDSLFLPNAVAIIGLGKCATLPKELGSDPIFALDNEPRNKELVKTMQELVDNKRTLCIWPDTIKEKDINEMVLAGAQSCDILNTILQNSCNGSTATLRLSKWRRSSISTKYYR